jgi:RHS repeat-associated protein
MQLSSGSHIPDGLLAAIALRNENSRLGVPSKNPALHQGIDASNSTIVLGLQSTAALNRVGSRCTGKERDGESGNDYFGARYYASTMGRFMSPDPSRLSIMPNNPQTWNRYSYVYNNPLGLKDDNGKWPTEIHNQIIDKAFPNLSPAQRQILKNVSASQDSILGGGQANGGAFEHAMRSPGQTVEQAETQYNNFVSGSETDAQNAQMQFWMADPDNKLDNLSEASLEAFGEALHAVVDSTSPAHAGFQEWNWMNPFAVYRHIQAEKTISPQQMQNAINAARNAYNATYGNLIGPMDNSSVTTTQGPVTPCGGSTGNPCPK